MTAMGGLGGGANGGVRTPRGTWEPLGLSRFFFDGSGAHVPLAAKWQRGSPPASLFWLLPGAPLQWLPPRPLPAAARGTNKAAHGRLLEQLL